MLYFFIALFIILFIYDIFLFNRLVFIENKYDIILLSIAFVINTYVIYNLL